MQHLLNHLDVLWKRTRVVVDPLKSMSSLVTHNVLENFGADSIAAVHQQTRSGLGLLVSSIVFNHIRPLIMLLHRFRQYLTHRI